MSVNSHQSPSLNTSGHRADLQLPTPTGTTAAPGVNRALDLYSNIFEATIRIPLSKMKPK